MTTSQTLKQADATVESKPQCALSITGLSHSYGERKAINNLSFDVAVGETFALLGPNGCGKTTLFRLLSTLMPLQAGRVHCFGQDLATNPAAVRSLLGVVFQSPSLDKKLRVEENLRHNGHLYGLSGKTLQGRIDEELERFRLVERRRDIVEELSGGLQRRAELAQCMLHKPKLLILDEPSTGLDPAARNDLWQRLGEAREEGVTLLVTTHLLEEAEHCDRLAIMNEGELAALDTPTALQASVGGDRITIRTETPRAMVKTVAERFQIEASVVDDLVRIETTSADELVPQLYAALRDEITELSVGKPTLEDVFLIRTGRSFHSSDAN